MSVAFRRESDEEHLEPKFERPIPPGPNLVTKRGLASIDDRIAELEIMRTQPADETRLAEMARDLRYWRARKASARLTPPSTGDEAGFGSRISYRQNSGPIQSIDIVGQDEADPTNGRIAFSAPLARAFIDAGVGDRVDFAGKADAIEILAVAPIPD